MVNPYLYNKCFFISKGNLEVGDIIITVICYDAPWTDLASVLLNNGNH